MEKKSEQNFSSTFEKILKYDNLKQVQKIIIIVFILVIVLDVLFVINQEDEFPTFSLLLHGYALKQYYVITWIWGLATAQIFFPKNSQMDTLSSLNKVIIVLSITCALLILGAIYKSIFESLWGQLFLFISGSIVGYFMLPNDLESSNTK